MSPSPETTTYTSRSVAETETVAGELSQHLASGGVVALEGELGAGKTQFVRGLVAALGGDVRQVHSPTYVLLHEYACAGGRRLFHLDAYRVGPDDFEAIGFEELCATAREGDVVAVEWPQKVAELIPAGAIWVRLEATSSTTRRISVRY
jgi:tRNA threonylcarbamoyladenosine biosynthesis protein TsaE